MTESDLSLGSPEGSVMQSGNASMSDSAQSMPSQSDASDQEDKPNDAGLGSSPVESTNEQPKEQGNVSTAELVNVDKRRYQGLIRKAQEFEQVAAQNQQLAQQVKALSAQFDQAYRQSNSVPSNKPQVPFYHTEEFANMDPRQAFELTIAEARRLAKEDMEQAEAARRQAWIDNQRAEKDRAERERFEETYQTKATADLSPEEESQLRSYMLENPHEVAVWARNFLFANKNKQQAATVEVQKALNKLSSNTQKVPNSPAKAPSVPPSFQKKEADGKPNWNLLFGP